MKTPTIYYRFFNLKLIIKPKFRRFGLMSIFFLGLFTLSNQLKAVTTETLPTLNKEGAVYVDKSVQSIGSFINGDGLSSNTFHLLSHGKPGELFIDNHWIGPKGIVTFLRTQNLEGITHINIYGCEFARGVKGLAAVQYLEKELNLNVSASDDITGINGDWDLEVGLNNDLFLSESLLSWSGNLQVSTSTCVSNTTISPDSIWGQDANDVFGGAGLSGLIDGNTSTYILNSTSTDGYDNLDYFFTSGTDISKVLIHNNGGSNLGNPQAISFIDEINLYDASGNLVRQLTDVSVPNGSVGGDPHEIDLGSVAFNIVRMEWKGTQGMSSGICFREVAVSSCTLPNADNDYDGVANNSDADNDNDGILDVDEGACESTTVYAFDMQATLNGISGNYTNGGTVQLVFNLKSGNAIPELGSQFTVPFTVSDISSNYGADYQWDNAIGWGIKSYATTGDGDFFGLAPLSSTFLTNMPSQNIRTFPFAQGDYVSGSADASCRTWIYNGLLAQLGQFSVTLGDIPKSNSDLYTLTNELVKYRNSFNVASNSSALVHGYWMRPSAQSENYFGPYATVKSYTSSFGSTVQYDVTGFSSNGTVMTSNAGGRLGFGIEEMELTYCVHRDTDGDGIPDYKDLDSDNDGCPDALENAGGFTYTQVEDGALSSGVDVVGVPTIANGGQTLGSSINGSIQSAECDACNPISTLFDDIDGDGVGDDCDLDNDNDGILDANEKDCINQSTFQWPTGITDVPGSGPYTIGNTSFLASLTINGGSSSTGIVGGTYDGWKLTHNGQEPYDPIVADITFEAPVNNLSFGIGDIDAGTTSGATQFNSEQVTVKLILSDGEVYSLKPGDFTAGTNVTYIGNNTFIGEAGGTPGYNPTVELNIHPSISDVKSVQVSYIMRYKPAFQNGYIMLFNNLSICTVADTDGDGVPDYKDIDSDNDGCPDALEGAGGIAASQLDSTNAVNSNVDVNGVVALLSPGGQDVGSSADATSRAMECINSTDPDIAITYVNVEVEGDLATNDYLPEGGTYGTPTSDPSNPGTETPTINPDGTYSFVSPIPGEYNFLVPVCPAGVSTNCPEVLLTITVLDQTDHMSPPVANTDKGTTKEDTPITIVVKENDEATNPGGSLGIPTIVDQPSNGTATVNPDGTITYDPDPSFIGTDTIKYEVCDTSITPASCEDALVIIDVLPENASNTTDASDDYASTIGTDPVSGNVLTNDTDPEGDNQRVTPQTTTVDAGTLTMDSTGAWSFTPNEGYRGPVQFPYTVCDDGTPQACTDATLHILVDTLVVPDYAPVIQIAPSSISGIDSIRVLLTINELLGGPSRSDVYIFVPKQDTRFQFNYVANAGVVGGIAVNNSDWEFYPQANPNFYIWKYTGTGGVFPAYGSSKIAFIGEYNPNNTDGQSTFSVQIFQGSGGEVNLSNNTDSDILIYFR